MDEKQLEDHHKGKECKNRPGSDPTKEYRDGRGDKPGENPVDGGPEGLARTPEVIRKDFGDKYPDHRALPDRMGGDKNKEEYGDHDPRPLQDKGCRYQPQGNNITYRPDVHELSSPQTVDQVDAQEGEHQIGKPDANTAQ